MLRGINSMVHNPSINVIYSGTIELQAIEQVIEGIPAIGFFFNGINSWKPKI